MKAYKKLDVWAMWIVSILISLGIGGLFINGTFTNTVILSFLPQIVHTVVGWLIIISTIGGAIWHLFMKK
jgi:hypothetical protein